MKCRAKNKAGKPCAAPAVEGTDRCVMHSGRAAELGRKGGRRRAVHSPDELKSCLIPVRRTLHQRSAPQLSRPLAAKVRF